MWDFKTSKLQKDAGQILSLIYIWIQIKFPSLLNSPQPSLPQDPSEAYLTRLNISQ